MINMFFQLIVFCFSVLNTEAANLRIYKSSEDYFKTPLSSPLSILNSTYFNVKIKTVIFTFGVNSSPDSKTAKVLKNSYLAYGKINPINLVLLDWQEGSNANDYGNYSLSLEKITIAMEVGHTLGDDLLILEQNGLDLNNVHLVGHSVGAHIMSYAAKRVKEHGKLLPRVTGLDPAGPLFDDPQKFPRLEPSDAVFVDAVHTDPGVFGINKSVGHVDIWLNCDKIVQPSCPTGKDSQGANDPCSHIQAAFDFGESLTHPYLFPAIKADSCKAWSEGKHKFSLNNIVYMGEDINQQARGNFYARTKASSPYGLGLVGINH